MNYIITILCAVIFAARSLFLPKIFSLLAHRNFKFVRHPLIDLCGIVFFIFLTPTTFIIAASYILYPAVLIILYMGIMLFTGIYVLLNIRHEFNDLPKKLPDIL